MLKFCWVIKHRSDISMERNDNDMKKFTLYSFRTDNEGGYGICKSEDFTPELDYEPQSG